MKLNIINLCIVGVTFRPFSEFFTFGPPLLTGEEYSQPPSDRPGCRPY